MKSIINIPLFVALSITTLLIGCSGNYAFNSNVKGDNVEEYFSASHVKIYENEKAFSGAKNYLGIVEGEDCQAKSHLAPPDELNARTQARQAAYKLQANAIVFTSCVNIESKQCVAQIVCYAKAYQVTDVQ
ncbi:rcsF protein [Colwellia sp. D2M02]|uniref:Rcs stress response system protein RcsF n=1 Tax=Colwellia sp. D2M02 TaxID=2841562 RepID=UPI001C09D76F|nr:Rcs stress response system protein RcsF [Colwellia sp. D2M02]MBU2894796.1 rcsF protein [Colwellia sp. D2M02]